jgi:hypothetical protein
MRALHFADGPSLRLRQQLYRFLEVGGHVFFTALACEPISVLQNDEILQVLTFKCLLNHLSPLCCRCSHKFFVSFIAYAFIGCLFVCVVAFPEFLELIGETTRPSTTSSRHGSPLMSPRKLDAMAAGRSSIATAVFVVGYILTSAFAVAS